MSEGPLPRDELRATTEARKELGEGMEPALIDSFVERIEQRLSQRGGEREKSLQHNRTPKGPRTPKAAAERRQFRLPRLTPGAASQRSCFGLDLLEDR